MKPKRGFIFLKSTVILNKAKNERMSKLPDENHSSQMDFI